MTSRRSHPIEADAPMFGLEELMPKPPEAVAPPEPDYTVPVNVKERAGSLIMAIDSLAQANKRRGFLSAAEDDPHRIDLQARYEGNLEAVTDGVADNMGDHLNTSFHHFRVASGYWALLRSGAIDKGNFDKFDKSTRADFRAFQGRFTGNPDKTKARDQYKRTLQVQAGMRKPVKTRSKKPAA